MNATENISSSAGMNIAQSAGANITETAGAMLTQNAGADYMLTAANIMEVSKGTRTSKAEDIKEHGKTKTSHTEEATVFNAKTDIHTKTNGKTKFS